MTPLDGAAGWPQWRLVRGEPSAEHDLDLLGPAERRRAVALRRPAERHTYVAAHAALRRLLGAQLDRDPAELTFVREPCPHCGAPNGRPALPGAPLHFSLSRADGLAVLAFADRQVGVDVEPPPAPEIVADVTETLHPAERAELSALPAAERPAAFARCWTRKEAVLKATGSGLGHGTLPTVLVGTSATPHPVPGWTLTDLALPEGYAAACAVRAHIEDSAD